MSGTPTPSRRKPRRAGVLEIAAWAIGAALILFYAYSRIHSAAAARTGIREFEKAREEVRVPAPAPAPPTEAAPSPVTASLPLPAVKFDLWSPVRIDAFNAASRESVRPEAILRIPRLGIEAPVYEGTDDVTLDRGVGRIDGTARPGEAGNLGIAGHRDGFFRGLKDIAAGDRIELALLSGNAGYHVESIRIVTPNDVDVLDPTPNASLTLVTCYPFYYVGSAPKRYIVHAVLENSTDTK
ncbi:MAG TPA: class D sortase [Thermoanaerobaculia bacterium]